jgi:AcrR family transcriptional regulator
MSRDVSSTESQRPASDRTHRDHAVTEGARRRPGKPGGKRDENRKAKTDALISAALPLFLAHGIEAVTIDDITRAAKAAKGSFYRYFSSKDALVEAIVAPAAHDVEQAFSRCAERLREAKDRASLFAAYQELALALVPLALHRLDVMRLYLQESRAPAVGARAPIVHLAEKIDRGAIDLTTVAVERGLLDVADPRISALAVVGAIQQLAYSVLSGKLDAPPVEIVATLIRLVLDGIAKPRERA